VDGVDNCGNLPNPNPSPSPSTDGLAQSTPPNFATGSTILNQGQAVADDGSDSLLSSANSQAAQAGVLAPTDIGGALAKIAGALAALAQYLQLLQELIKLLKKLLAKGNKTTFRYDYGSIQRDGFIQLYPSPPPPEVQALYLDIRFTSVPIGKGKLFGDKSPHRYKYETLGSIRFVSDTFGVLRIHELEHIRNSIEIPELAFGFFYHLGLDGVSMANASGYFLKEETE
jgi:hypothetical protein